VETDATRPLNVYGWSKAEAEKKVLNACPAALIVRTSSFFGPWDEYNFLTQTMRQWSMGNPVYAPEDAVMTPTYVPDLVRVCLDLLIDRESGIWHVSNSDKVSWAQFADRLAEMTGYPTELVKRCTYETLGYPARRPKFSALSSVRGRLMPSLDHSLERYLEDAEHEWVSRAPLAPGTRTYRRNAGE
jgi:dTDP-4-dehydrorhamnose reductase